jgi:hypothetical protein
LAAALIISQLPATPAKADLTINDDGVCNFRSLNSGAYTDFTHSVTNNTLNFSVQFGNGIQTDAEMFSPNSIPRFSFFDITGTTSGSMSAGDHILFNYTITTTLLSGSTTAVTYNGSAVLTDATYDTFAGNDSDWTGSGSVSDVSLGTGSTANHTISGTTATGGNINSYVFTKTRSSSGFAGAYDANSYDIRIDSDWNIDDTLGSTFSSSEILAVTITGSMSIVPESSSWGFIGASGALGAALVFSRRKKTAANGKIA